MKLNIFGKKIRVFKQKGLMDATNWMGYYEKAKNRIVVDADLSPEEYNETLIHEVLEAIFCRASFNQSINDDAKEIIIDIIAKNFNENFKLVCKNGKN